MADVVIGDGEGKCIYRFNPAGVGGERLIVIGFQWDVLKTPDAQAEVLYDAWAGNMMAELTNNLILEEVDVVINDAGTLREGVHTGTATGADNVAAAAPNLAYLIRKRTGLAGNQFRGRMYVPGCAEDDVTGSGTVLSPKVASLQVAAAAFLAELVTEDSNMLILHAPPLVGPTPPSTEVVTLTVDPLAATQRRRMR